MQPHSRTALVTGGAKRVGRAIAERLADAGLDVVITYLNSKPAADAFVASRKSKGQKRLAIQADLTRPKPAIDHIFDEITAIFGGIDLLINNASLYEPDEPQRADSTQMRRLFAIHAEAPLLLARRFESSLRDRGGHIINMVDLMAQRPSPRFLAYCASKSALQNLTMGLARQLAPQVTVNGIAPGVVQWPDDYPQADRDAYLQRVPLGRAGTPHDVAQLVHYLVTDGNYITGQIIRLDGGRSIL